MPPFLWGKKKYKASGVERKGKNRDSNKGQNENRLRQF